MSCERFYCCDKTPRPKHLGRERVSFSSQLCIERGWSWCRGHGGLLLSGLLAMTCSFCSHITLGTTNPRVALPTVSWTLQPLPSINEVYHRLAHRSTLWGHFLCSGSFLKNESSLGQVASLGGEGGPEWFVSWQPRNRERMERGTIYHFQWHFQCPLFYS